MNRANAVARQRTAVDVLNAMILVIKLEGYQFEYYKQKAWRRKTMPRVSRRNPGADSKYLHVQQICIHQK